MRLRAAVLTALLLPMVIVVPAGAQGSAIELVSGTGGTSSNGASGGPSVSADGRFVAFHSRGSDLVAGDRNGSFDIFVLDRLTSTMTLISRSITRDPADDDSLNPSISDDGRYIAYQSEATDLVASDTNGESDVFVHDRITGSTTRLSIGAGGAEADGGSGVPSLSGDGRLVAFQSNATNLVGGDDNETVDVFVANHSSGAVELVSVATGGGPGNGASFDPVISGDGRHVAFATIADDLVGGDDDGNYDIVVRDLGSSSSRLASVGAGGEQLPGDSFDPAIDTDGSHVAFRVTEANLGDTRLDVRVWNRGTDRSELVSAAATGGPANGDAYAPSISGDGIWVAFHATATDLVADDLEGQLDVFVRDLAGDTTVRASAGEERGGDRRSLNAAISRDGATVVFETDATNLFADDRNGLGDVVLREGLTAGAPDVDPPEVVQVDLTPRSIDVADLSSTRSIDVAVSLADRSGAVAPSFLLADVVTGETTASVTATLAQGTDRNGTWTATVTLPDELDAGEVWRLRVLDRRDVEGNTAPVTVPDGFATDVVVVDGSADVTPPEVVSFGFSPAQTVSGLGETITFRLRARDPSGVLSPELEIFPPLSGPSLGPVTLALASGTALDGEWVGTVDVPIGAAVGTWTVVLDSLRDGAGNLGPAGVPSGFPRDLVVAEGSGAPDAGTSGDGGTGGVPGTGGTGGDGSAGDGSTGDGGGSTGGDGSSGDGSAGDGGGSTGGVDAPSTPSELGLTGYWMLGDNGNVHRFGDAEFHGGARAAVEGAAARAVDIEPSPTGDGYWILDDSGEVHAFGGAVDLGDVVDSLPVGESAASLSATPTGDGYWIFTDRGRTLGFGLAEFYGDVSHLTLNGPVIDSVATPTGAGYYMVASDGGIFAFGDAEFRGSMGGIPLNQPVVGLAPTPDNLGYWLVASDGGVFAFDASFRGSMGSTALNAPVSGMVAYGDGYLLVATDGGIFSFSDRGFDGSLGSNPPNYPIISVAPLP
ncbi:MAG: hypothetical protein AAFZ07_25215 [Actinomycetota bacterium]